MGLIVFAKVLEGGETGKETPLNGCGVGILGMITVNT
jgi:hypothetical protein